MKTLVKQVSPILSVDGKRDLAVSRKNSMPAVAVSCNEILGFFEVNLACVAKFVCNAEQVVEFR